MFELITEEELHKKVHVEALALTDTLSRLGNAMEVAEEELSEAIHKYLRERIFTGLGG